MSVLEVPFNWLLTGTIASFGSPENTAFHPAGVRSNAKGLPKISPHMSNTLADHEGKVALRPAKLTEDVVAAM
jgi:hypothetical protein